MKKLLLALTAAALLSGCTAVDNYNDLEERVSNLEETVNDLSTKIELLEAELDERVSPLEAELTELTEAFNDLRLAFDNSAANIDAKLERLEAMVLGSKTYSAGDKTISEKIDYAFETIDAMDTRLDQDEESLRFLWQELNELQETLTKKISDEIAAVKADYNAKINALDERLKKLEGWTKSNVLFDRAYDGLYEYKQLENGYYECHFAKSNRNDYKAQVKFKVVNEAENKWKEWQDISYINNGHSYIEVCLDYSLTYTKHYDPSRGMFADDDPYIDIVQNDVNVTHLVSSVFPETTDGNNDRKILEYAYWAFCQQPVFDIGEQLSQYCGEYKFQANQMFFNRLAGSWVTRYPTTTITNIQ